MRSAFILSLVTVFVSLSAGAAEEKSLHESGKHTEGACAKQAFAIVKGKQVPIAQVKRAEDKEFAQIAEYRAKQLYKKFFDVKPAAKLNVVKNTLSYGKDDGDSLKKLQGVTVEIEEDGSDEMYLVLQFTPHMDTKKPVLLMGIHEHQGSEAYWVCEDLW